MNVNPVECGLLVTHIPMLELLQFNFTEQILWNASVSSQTADPQKSFQRPQAKTPSLYYSWHSPHIGSWPLQGKSKSKLGY